VLQSASKLTFFDVLIMASSIFPKEWWKLPQEEYLEAKASMKALAQKDCEVGTKEVRDTFSRNFKKEMVFTLLI